MQHLHIAAVELQAAIVPHCSWGVQPGGICAHAVQREATPGAQQEHTRRGAIGGDRGDTAQSALIGRDGPIIFLFLCRKKRNHFALSQRDYGKYVLALAPGGAARSTKVLSKRAIEGPSI